MFQSKKLLYNWCNLAWILIWLFIFKLSFELKTPMSVLQRGKKVNLHKVDNLQFNVWIKGIKDYEDEHWLLQQFSLSSAPEDQLNFVLMH